MRKFLLPLLSLVNIVLLAVVFGVAAQNVGTRVDGSNFGNYYQLVFERGQNLFALISFICLVVGGFFTLVNLLPLKARKFTSVFHALVVIASGVFMLLGANKALEKITVSGSLVAIAVLMFVAGFVSILMALLEFSKKSEAK